MSEITINELTALIQLLDRHILYARAKRQSIEFHSNLMTKLLQMRDEKAQTEFNFNQDPENR